MTLRDFIKKRRYLFWYVEKPENLSEEAVIEAVLNYGDWADVQKLFSILGIKKTAKIFYEQTRRKRVNYDSKIAHYFNLYFKKHVRSFT